MRLRYQVGDVPELRFATVAEACEKAAEIYSQVDGPPLLPIDRATAREVGAELLGVMLEKIHSAQCEILAASWPGDVGEDGQRYYGARP